MQSAELLLVRSENFMAIAVTATSDVAL